MNKEINTLKDVMENEELAQYITEDLEDFTDDTEVTFQALSEINTTQAGEYAVEIQAADTSGNLTTVSTKLQVWDVSHILKAELNGAEIEKTICAKHPDIIENQGFWIEYYRYQTHFFRCFECSGQQNS